MSSQVNPKGAGWRGKNKVGINVFQIAILLPAFLVLCLFCGSLLYTFNYINKMAKSASQDYLPKILINQRTLIDLENLRRYVETIYSAEDPALRRTASLNASALGAESVFEPNSPFAKYANTVQKLIHELADARTASDRAADAFHHEELILVEKSASLTTLLKMAPVEIPMHNSKHLSTASEREQVENDFLRVAFQPIHAVCLQVNEEHDTEPQVLTNCALLHDSDQRMRQAWQDRIEADSRARTIWRQLDTQFRELSNAAYSAEAERTYIAMNGITGKIQSSSIWLPLFMLLTVSILIFACGMFYRFIVYPITAAANHIQQLKTGIIPNDLPRMHVREMQTLLETLPHMIRQITELSDLSGTLEKEKDKYINMSYIDALTGVNNRRSFDQQLAMESRAHNLSILMLDVDQFKLYNDALGHQAGDAALISVARAMEQALLRSSDRVFRYGGEEFVVILPDATEDAAMSVAARILIAVRNMNIPHPSSTVAKVLTVSIGVSSRESSNDCNDEELVAQADMALYRAKSSGRNRICVYLPGDVSPPPQSAHVSKS